MTLTLLVLVFCLSTLLSSSGAAGGDSPKTGVHSLLNEFDSSVINSDVRSTVDLTTSLVKIISTVSITNTGASPVSTYTIAIPPYLSNNLAWVSAVPRGEDSSKALRIKKVNITSPLTGTLFFDVSLSKPLKPTEKVTLTIDVVATHALHAFPALIMQSERQFMKFLGSAHFYSPYRTEAAIVTVQVPSPNIIAFTKGSALEPVDKRETTITYGSYKDLPPFSLVPIEVHFESNVPFLAVTRLERWIEVSHWGNIAVEEKIEVRHTGAELAGGFSRFDYQRVNDGIASVRGFRTILPAAARDVYYRDEIGNISTSHLRENLAEVELELQPRFPLFGGWRTYYVLGYNLPAHEYLFQRGSEHALRMRFIDHVFDDQIVDELTLRIVLPECASNIRVKNPPYDVEQLPFETHKTYLDTTGRTVLVFKKRNLVEQHIKDVEIRYSFSRVMLLREPLMIIAFFFIIFASVIAIVRLDFSLTKDEAKDSRDRVALLTEKVQGVQDRLQALYQAHDDALSRYKQQKDQQKLASDKKKLETERKTLKSELTDIQNRLKVENHPALAEKVGELALHEAAVWELLAAEATRAERLVAGTLNREDYLEAKSTSEGKLKEQHERTEGILNTMQL